MYGKEYEGFEIQKTTTPTNSVSRKSNEQDHSLWEPAKRRRMHRRMAKSAHAHTPPGIPYETLVNARARALLLGIDETRFRKARVINHIRLEIPAGKANSAPPIGPALGLYGIKIAEFCKSFNAETQNYPKGIKVPVVITVFADRSFVFKVMEPQSNRFSGRISKEMVDELRKVATASQKAKAPLEVKPPALDFSEIVRPGTPPSALDLAGDKWFLLNFAEFGFDNIVKWAHAARTAARDKGVFVFKVIVFSNYQFTSDINRRLDGTGVIVRRYRDQSFMEAVTAFEAEIRRNRKLIESRQK